MELKIDKMTISDLNLIKDILITEFDDFWNYDILKQELISDTSHFIVVKDTNQNILGFAGFKVILDEADIMNIVVKKDLRQNKIGHFLLENLLIYIKEFNINTVTLEVNENNIPAINLYKKFGFETIGLRKKYYNNTDNAILMLKKI